MQSGRCFIDIVVRIDSKEIAGIARHQWFGIGLPRGIFVYIGIRKRGGRGAVNTTRGYAHHSFAHVSLTIIGMTGIAALFLPFAWDTSPMEAISLKELWRLALPFFLAVLASAASFRWIITGSFSGFERATAYVASGLMAGVTLSLWFPVGPSSPQEWLTLISPVPILALGIYLLIRNSRRGPSREFNPVMAIEISYLAHASLCLVGFLERLELGAYFVLIAALAFVIQIILASGAPFPEIPLRPMGGRG